MNPKQNVKGKECSGQIEFKMLISKQWSYTAVFVSRGHEDETNTGRNKEDPQSAELVPPS